MKILPPPSDFKRIFRNSSAIGLNYYDFSVCVL